MDWKEFSSKKRDGLFLVLDSDDQFISNLYYDPYKSVFGCGNFLGDDPEFVEDWELELYKQRLFFELPEDFAKEINPFLEKWGET